MLGEKCMAWNRDKETNLEISTLHLRFRSRRTVAIYSIFVKLKIRELITIDYQGRSNEAFIIRVNVLLKPRALFYSWLLVEARMRQSNHVRAKVNLKLLKAGWREQL